MGMRAIKQRGGMTVVQDPTDATFPSMPSSVIQNMSVDYSVPLREIGPLLTRLAQERVAEVGGYPVAGKVELEAKIAGQEMDAGQLFSSVEQLGVK